MSSHNQLSPAQKTGDGRHANLETALRIATVIAEANERLFKIQTEAANVAFAENSKHLKALLNTANTKDSGVLLAEWTNLYQASMHRGLDVTRRCFEIVPQTQAEIAKLVGEPFTSANKQTQQYLDQFTKAIGDGRDAAAASVKDFLAKVREGAVGEAVLKSVTPGQMVVKLVHDALVEALGSTSAAIDLNARAPAQQGRKKKLPKVA